MRSVGEILPTGDGACGRGARGVALMGLVVVVLAGVAEAGTIRHDRADSWYTSLAGEARYAPVGEIIGIYSDFSGTRGSGTLITSEWVLTAAHVVDDYASFTNGFYITIPTHSGGSVNITPNASNIRIHPNWTGDLSAGWDMALVRLDSAINDVTPATLFNGTDERGYTGTSVGYGRTGDGNTGDTGASGTRRAGLNIIDAFGSEIPGGGYSDNLFFSDFDPPGGWGSTNHALGSSTPLDYEYSIAPGDSGGGTFIEVGGETLLAGVHSLGLAYNPPWGDGSVDSSYTDYFASTRVSQFQGWIESIVGAGVASFSAGGGAVAPEPAGIAALATVVLVLHLSGRRLRGFAGGPPRGMRPRASSAPRSAGRRVPRLSSRAWCLHPHGATSRSPA